MADSSDQERNQRALEIFEAYLERLEAQQVEPLEEFLENHPELRTELARLAREHKGLFDDQPQTPSNEGPSDDEADAAIDPAETPSLKLLNRLEDRKGTSRYKLLESPSVVVALTNNWRISRWRVPSGEELSTVDIAVPHPTNRFFRRTVISADAQTIALSDLQNNVITMIDSTTGQILRTLPMDEKFLPRMAISRDGSMLALASLFSSSVVLIDTTSGARRPFTIPEAGYPLDVTALSFGPNTRLAIGLSDGSTQILDSSTQARLHDSWTHEESVSSICFSDTELLVSSDARGVVRAWSTSEKPRSSISLPAESYDILQEKALAFLCPNPRRNRVLLTMPDGSIKASFSSSIPPVEAPALDDSGTRVAVASHEGQLSILDAATGLVLRILKQGDPGGVAQCSALAFSRPHGKIVEFLFGTSIPRARLVRYS